MREYENEHTFHNAIALAVKGDKDSLFVVMEGEDDSFLLKQWVGDSIRIMPGRGGKGNVIRVAEKFAERGQNRVKFVIDRDYDAFSSRMVEYPSNVICSSNHDCFVDVVAAHAHLLPLVVDYHLDSARRSGGKRAADLVNVSVDDIVGKGFELASMLAACRIVDFRYSLGLKFKCFKYVGEPYDRFSASYIMQRIIELNKRSELNVDKYCEKVERVLCEVRDYSFPPVGDHDLFSALNYVVSLYSRAPSEKVLRLSVLSSLSVERLRKIWWCKLLEDWCSSYEVAFFVQG